MSENETKVETTEEVKKDVKTDSEGGDKSENIFLSPECPIRKITVYADRAEVCRVINAKPTKGINEILLKNLPSCIDGDSIRVEGKGDATIEEVSYQVKFIGKDKAELNQKQKELKEIEAELKREKEDLNSVLTVVKKQWEVLNNFAKAATSGIPKEETTKTYFDSISGFLSLYKKEGSSLEESRLTLERKLEDIESRILANTRNLTSVFSKNKEEESRECTIVLDATTEVPVELVVSYVVSRASWEPSYDIRMFTAEGVMKIMYYGQIQQSTGEDWDDAKIFLSTASPSIGGAIPELESVVLGLKDKYRSYPKSRGMLLNSIKPKMVSLSLKSSSYDCYDPTIEDSYGGPPPPPPRMDLAVTQVADTTTSTSYEIARNSTIPSDNIQHKVSVGIIDLKPRLEYITIPKKVPRAFLTAKLTNTSQFTLLPGPTSIFLDNSFVAKASLRSVSPQEEFECSLGVDPSVRIIYKPLKKYQETTGFISKQKNMMHHQEIKIKNTHEYQIKILVKDNLPQSGVDKIKVNLVEPQIDLKHPEKNKDIRLNPKQNHIEWDLTVEKQETKSVTLKYSVELPANEEIEQKENNYENCL